MKAKVFFLVLTLWTIPNMTFSQNLEIPGPYHWKNRILLVFSADESQKQNEQIAVLEKHQEGLNERELVVFEIEENQVNQVDGTRYGEEAADKLRKQYNVDEDHFSVILIGKDGTEKLRQSELLSIEKLFSTIDAMPMRKQEMKKNGGG